MKHCNSYINFTLLHIILKNHTVDRSLYFPFQYERVSYLGKLFLYRCLIQLNVISNAFLVLRYSSDSTYFVICLFAYNDISIVKVLNSNINVFLANVFIVLDFLWVM